MTDIARFYGTVREFSRTRGLGVIELDGSQAPVSVRYSAILGEGLRFLHSGQRVSFELEENTQGLSALRVLSE